MKHVFILIILELIFVCLGLIVGSILPLYRVPQDRLLVVELLRVEGFVIPTVVIFLIGCINIGLVYLVGQKLFNGKTGFFSALVFTSSPWVWYMSAASSVMILEMFFVLLVLTSVLFLKHRIWIGILGLGLAGCVFSSSLLWVFALGLVFYINVSKSKSKGLVNTISGVILITLIAICLQNWEGVVSYFRRVINVFDNVGLLNGVNQMQGELGSWAGIGRLIENKYVYYLKHLTFTLISYFSPVVYFTNQYRLLGFSFTAPILLAWLPFLVMGLKTLGFKKVFIFGILFVSLIVPSWIYKGYPDLGKLILVLPLFSVLIAFGFRGFLSSVHRFKKIGLLVFIFIWLFQFLVVMGDISSRELERFTSLIR